MEDEFKSMFGCRMKDDAAGEVPVAFVVKSKDSQLSEDDIKKYISKQVIIYLIIS